MEICCVHRKFRGKKKSGRENNVYISKCFIQSLCPRLLSKQTEQKEKMKLDNAEVKERGGQIRRERLRKEEG